MKITNFFKKDINSKYELLGRGVCWFFGAFLIIGVLLIFLKDTYPEIAVFFILIFLLYTVLAGFVFLEEINSKWCYFSKLVGSNILLKALVGILVSLSGYISYTQAQDYMLLNYGLDSLIFFSDFLNLLSAVFFLYYLILFYAFISMFFGLLFLACVGLLFIYRYISASINPALALFSQIRIEFENVKLDNILMGRLIAIVGSLIVLTFGAWCVEKFRYNIFEKILIETKFKPRGLCIELEKYKISIPVEGNVLVLREKDGATFFKKEKCKLKVSE